MLDPSSIYSIDEAAAAKLTVGEGAHGPVLLHAVRGLVDAGGTGELAVDHLVGRFGAERLVSFDTDQLVAYRSRRPAMIFDSDRWTGYEAPELVVDVLHDAEGTPFLLLHGLEPDVQWERFVAAVIQIVDRFAVSLVVGIQGVPMAVPHTRPMTSTGHGTRDGLLLPQPHVFGKVQVPASVSNLLEYRLGEAGRDAVGFAVHVPHYLAQGHFAPGAIEALEQVQRATGLLVEPGGLEVAAREAQEEINRQMAGSDEVQAVVHALEGQYDSYVKTIGRTNLLAESVPLPSADELGAQFEQFLAEHDEAAGEPGDGKG